MFNYWKKLYDNSNRKLIKPFRPERAKDVFSRIVSNS